MRIIILCLIAIGLEASSAIAAADDDKGARSTEKTRASSSSATPTDTAKAETPRAPSALESELQQLRQLVQEQNDRLRGLQQRLADIEGQVAAAKSDSDTVAHSATPAKQPSTPAESGTPTGQPAGAPQEAQEAKKKPSPLYFEIGKAKFSPGGFLDFTSFTRSTNPGSGIATSFGSIPFNNTTQGRLSETHLSAQYSRLSLKVDAPATNSTSFLIGRWEPSFPEDKEFMSLHRPEIGLQRSFCLIRRAPGLT